MKTMFSKTTTAGRLARALPTAVAVTAVVVLAMQLSGCGNESGIEPGDCGAADNPCVVNDDNPDYGWSTTTVNTPEGPVNCVIYYAWSTPSIACDWAAAK